MVCYQLHSDFGKSHLHSLTLALHWSNILIGSSGLLLVDYDFFSFIFSLGNDKYVILDVRNNVPKNYPSMKELLFPHLNKIICISVCTRL